MTNLQLNSSVGIGADVCPRKDDIVSEAGWVMVDVIPICVPSDAAAAAEGFVRTYRSASHCGKLRNLPQTV